MSLDLTGLKPLDTTGLNSLDTGGLTELDTTGLTPISGAEVPPGRARTASSSLVRGFSSVVSGIPKSLALATTPEPSVWRNLDRIDRGEPYRPKTQYAGSAGVIELADPLTSFYEGYTSASPEQRQQVRTQWTEQAEKAQKSALYKAGNAIDKFIADKFPVDPALQDEFWTSKVPQGLGSALGFVSAALVTRGVVGTSALATYGAPAVLGSSLNSVDQFEQAIDSGADIATALEASKLGAIIGTTEAIPVGNLLNRLDKVGGGVIKRYLARAVRQGTEEAVQESFAGIMNAAVAQKLYDPERGVWTTERVEEGAVGFTTGAILETLFTLALPGRRRGAGGTAPDTTPDTDSAPKPIEEVAQLADERLQTLEAIEAPTEAETAERDFLRDNRSAPAAIADAYGIALQPIGERERARTEVDPLSQEDLDSPIPNELISSGRAVLQDALGQQAATEMLVRAGFPEIGTQITVSGEPATVIDAYEQDGVIGAKLQYDDGRTVAEPFDTLRGRIAPIEVKDAPQTDEAQGIEAVTIEPTAPGREETPDTTQTPARPIEPPRDEILTQPALDVEGLTPVAAIAPEETGLDQLPQLRNDVRRGTEPGATAPASDPERGASIEPVEQQLRTITAPTDKSDADGVPGADTAADPGGALTPETAESGAANALRGERIDDEWVSFAETSGSLNVPRTEMPQIKAEHRGALANFLKARDIAGVEETVPAISLKPTQAEFSEKKVRKAMAFEGGDRAILVSREGNVLDGHHQWLAAVEAGKDIRVIRLDAPIAQLLKEVPEFPSAEGGLAESAQAVESQATADLSSPVPAGEISSEVRDSLEIMKGESGWAEIGGRVLMDQDGEVTGRTPWVPKADWWKGRPGNYNEAQTERIIDKGLAGKYLGTKPREYFNFLVEVAQERNTLTKAFPTPEELAFEDLDETPQNADDVALVATATEIDEDAVERLATRFEDDDAGFIAGVRDLVAASQKAAAGSQASAETPAEPSEELTLTAQSAPETATSTPPATQPDLLGDDTVAAQALADEKRKRDTGRNTGQDSIETGKPDDLFSQARQQTDLTDAPKKTPKPSADIEDFGEVLTGARKHVWAAYQDNLTKAAELDVAVVPLSKSWPAPNYETMLEAGADPWSVAFIRTARDTVPNKPRKAWKAKRWVEQTKVLREMARQVLDGTLTQDTITAKLRNNAEFLTLRTELDASIDLYQAVGHSKSLKGIRLREGKYSLFGGKKYNPPKVIWTVSRAAKATAFSNWPIELAKGNTRDAAIGNFKAEFDNIDTQPKASKQVKFSIYSYRRGPKAGRFVIGKKLGKDRIDLREFDNIKEARKYLDENHDALVSDFKRWKELPADRRPENAPRVGSDHRDGADVTPTVFAETFGFRGVQFGNYVEGKRRQQDLNSAYDALMDLAGVLDVPAQALSLNGRLGLAFGARGTGGAGAAAAHFEADTVVINLTKRSGSGSLAHEWLHSMDNYFSRNRGQNDGFLSEDAVQRGEGVRPEVVEAFDGVVQAISQTSLKQRSESIDKRRTNAYWSTGREMTARAFESYIIAKLQDQGASNDYLANIVSEQYWKAEAALSMGFQNTGEAAGYPYPTPAEIPVIRAAFDHLFETIESRETATGVEMFSLRDDAPWYFSSLARAAEGLKQAKGQPDQMLAMLKKQPGVKAEEIQWTGIEEWLATQEGAVTKAEIVEYLAGNGVRVEDVTLQSSNAGLVEIFAREGYTLDNSDAEVALYLDPEGNEIEFDDLPKSLKQAIGRQMSDDFTTTKYQDHVLPGGENYREVLLTLPRREDIDPNSPGSPLASRDAGVFIDGHFDTANVLAHVRLNDRSGPNGEKVLFIEELQSDWHQTGRRKGYRSDKPLTPDDAKRFFGITDVDWAAMGPAQQLSYLEEMNSDARHVRIGKNEMVPDAPFKGNAWVELAIKRVIRMAAEGGYDQVAWTTGEQQADRYDLSKRLEYIDFEPNGSNYAVIARDRGGNIVFDRKAVKPEELEDIVGKDVAEKIINGEGAPSPRADEKTWRRLSGLDLRVGGEGMKGFYDRTLRNLFSKVTKKLDRAVKVESIGIGEGAIYEVVKDGNNWWVESLNTPRQGPFESHVEATQYIERRVDAGRESIDVHSIQITPAMREQALLGLPLFTLQPGVAGKADAIESDLKARLDKVGITDRVAVKLVDEIRNSAGSAMSGAQGRYLGRLIEVAADAPNKAWVMDHEVIHALRDIGVIRTAEWTALARAAEDRMDSVRQRYSGRNLTEQQLVEEAIADLHADWSTSQKQARGFLKTAFQRISEFLEALGNALRGAGFQSAGDIFRRIDRGEVGRRDGVAANEKRQRLTLLADTRRIYESRIDELFAGEKPDPTGVRILDRSDVLAMHGIDDGPVFLVESKVSASRFNHRLTAEDWKKVPNWLENPTLVFESETQPGRLVFIAPDPVGESLVRIIAAPRPNGGTTLIVSVYEDGRKSPLKRWVEDGLLRYIDQRKTLDLSGRSGLRLPGLQEVKGYRDKVLTRKDLVKYREDNSPEGRLALQPGDFNPNRPRKSVETAPEPTPDRQSNLFLSEAIFRFQDKFNYLYKAQKTAAKERGLEELAEPEDAYLSELRYHGMAGAAIEDFQRDHVDPLVEKISESGLDIEDVESYLHARHAPEANAQLKRINPIDPQKDLNIGEDGDKSRGLKDNDGLSGMTNEAASTIIADFEASGDLQKLEEIAALTDAITASQRKLLVESGLETAKTVAKWESTYEFYVPLQREGFGDTPPQRGKGFSVTGRQKRRAGSKREVVSILSHLTAQHEATLIRAEKNKVAQAMLRFAQNNPNEELYAVDKVEFKATFDAEGLVVYKPHRGFQFADNVLVVKVAGKDHTVTFNQRSHEAMRIAHAMKSLGANNSGPIINVLTRVMRYLAAINTGYNPEFIISNFLRDIQTAGYNLSSTEVDSLKWTIIKDVGKAWRGIRAFQSQKDHPWAKEFDEFRKAGAQTGWLGLYGDISQKEDRLRNRVEELRGDVPLLKVKRSVRALFEFIENENTAVENAVRLSAFVHARRAGISVGKSARLAKELTVNFNRKGDYGQIMNALWLFYNASIQGSARIIVGAAKSPKVRVLIGATIVFATFLDIMNRAMGGDDEDGKNRYDKIPDHVKERNLIFMLPGGKGDYVKIPLPWGYNVFHVMGQVTGEAATKKNFKASAGALRVAASVAGSFNPIGGDASLGQIISPTITDPIVQWGENKDWAGRPLRPEGNPFDVDAPESQQYWNSVREPSRWVAEKLNELTGGNEFRSGTVDINPEMIDLIIDNVTGGAGRFIADTVSTPIKALKGDEIETYEIPLLRKLYGQPGLGTLYQEYYRNADAVRITEKEAKHYIETKNIDAELELKEARWGEYSLIGERRKSDSYLMKQRKERNRIDESDLSDAEKKRQISNIGDEIKDTMNQFNRLYNERVNDQ